jgi:hypothetical protein
MKGFRRFSILLATLAIGYAWQGSGINFGTPVSANQPNAGLEFSLHVNACSTAPDQSLNCVVPNNVPFVVSVSLDSIPGPYTSLGFKLTYEGIDSKDDPDIVWPDCVGETTGPADGITVTAQCSVAGPPSTYTGTVFTATFNCLADSHVEITHGPADTYLVDSLAKTSTDNGPDHLDIECLTPTDTPTPTNTPVPPTPTPTPTQPPGPVGGAGFDAMTGAGGGRLTQAFTMALATVVIVSGLVFALGWQQQRRR